MLIYRKFVIVLAVSTLVGLMQCAHAEVIQASPNGGLIRSVSAPLTGGNVNGVRRIGASADGTEELASVYFFELPTFVATDLIATAELSFTFSDFDGDPNFNIDLYGLGFVDSDTLDADWFYEGANPDPASSASYGTGGPANLVSLIEPDVLTPATIPGSVISINSQGLVNFLNAAIDNGATTGDFAVFRLNADADTSPFVGTGFNVGHSSPSTPASLSLTAVPVPATIWLLLSAGIALASRRNTHRH